MPDLNSIKINLFELRKHIAALQKDGYEEIGLEDLLKYIYNLKHPLGDVLVSPLRNKPK